MPKRTKNEGVLPQHRDGGSWRVTLQEDSMRPPPNPTREEHLLSRNDWRDLRGVTVEHGSLCLPFCRPTRKDAQSPSQLWLYAHITYCTVARRQRKKQR